MHIFSNFPALELLNAAISTRRCEYSALSGAHFCGDRGAVNIEHLAAAALTYVRRSAGWRAEEVKESSCNACRRLNAELIL